MNYTLDEQLVRSGRRIAAAKIWYDLMVGHYEAGRVDRHHFREVDKELSDAQAESVQIKAKIKERGK